MRVDLEIRCDDGRILRASGNEFETVIAILISQGITAEEFTALQTAVAAIVVTEIPPEE